MSEARENSGESTGDEQSPPVEAPETTDDEAKVLGEQVEMDIGDVAGDVKKLVAERDEYLDSLRRLQADFDNYRKRAVRQQTDLLERASERLLIELLPVLDALDLAEAHASTAGEGEGTKALSQIGTLLRGTLERAGLERIDAIGVPFDPNIHDAVAHEAASSPETATTGATSEVGTVQADGSLDNAGTGANADVAGGTTGVPGDLAGATGSTAGVEGTTGGAGVIEVMRAGYRRKGRVLRPAMVKVKG